MNVRECHTNFENEWDQRRSLNQTVRATMAQSRILTRLALFRDPGGNLQGVGKSIGNRSR